MKYDAAAAAAFYDEYGEQEWTRFEDGRTSAISLMTHLHYLRHFVQAGDRVLDIGCGPGRFTLELAALGARTVAADISPRQLELHRRNVPDDAVESRLLTDVVDLSQFERGEFDAVVCYGGPISYALDRAPDAVAELACVTRPGGHVLVSVMSLIGSTLGAIGGVTSIVERYGADTVRRVTQTGHLLPEHSGGHLEMKLFRSRELAALLEPHGTVVATA
ncbi:MAG TPA: class I SAM-dependent methyltransferase, partial [Gaiellaceae bacterium]|nr:class I SAM-dependent methyltransferase [Gaiellaceae bacterium]